MSTKSRPKSGVHVESNNQRLADPAADASQEVERDQTVLDASAQPSGVRPAVSNRHSDDPAADTSEEDIHPQPAPDVSAQLSGVRVVDASDRRASDPGAGESVDTVSISKTVDSPADPDERLLTPIGNLLLSTDTVRALLNADLRYVGDIVRRSGKQIQALPDLPRSRGFKEIRAAIRRLNLSFNMVVDKTWSAPTPRARVPKKIAPQGRTDPSSPSRVRRKNTAQAVSDPGADESVQDVRPPDGIDLSASFPLLTMAVAECRELQSQRKFCIVSQSRCNRSVESFLARMLGYSPDLAESARLGIFKRAKDIRERLEKSGLEGNWLLKAEPAIVHACQVAAPLVAISASSRAAWDGHRKAVELQMRKLARTFPCESYRAGVRGLGELGVAVIVGEAGALHNYETKERLWKRLGLAVINGERQRRVKDPELAVLHGYNPRRRAEVWTVADSLLRGQWAGDKDEDGKNPKETGKSVAVSAHALGPYGLRYAARKAHTATREGWSRAHRDADARRVMSKFMLKHLWQSWRRELKLAVPEDHEEPLEELSGEAYGEVDGYAEGVEDEVEVNEMAS